jgi:hypothetical protein
LNKLHQNKLFANKAKIEFTKKSKNMNFLGHILSSEEVRLNPRKLKAIKD